MAKARSLPHVRFETVGKAIAAVEDGSAIKACCRKCELFQRVPLELLLKAEGPDYRLFNRTIRCARYECDGRAFFLVQVGQGVPFRPLLAGP